MKKYTHIYFDLDRTLWDFEANALETFRDLFDKHNLRVIFDSFEAFHKTYQKHNEKLWMDYREQKISKHDLRNRRFELTLKEFGTENSRLAQTLGDEYIALSPQKTRLFPGTHEVLDYLSAKQYKLHIITNGFNEVQFLKLKNSKLEHYFSKVVTSENAGAQKPRPEIFHYALSSVHARKEESLMIGDDLTGDILGAQKYGIDQVFCNFTKQQHQEKPTYEIQAIKDLKQIL
ncbi:MAG: YjjG family noncanonical pyrimidine nucleotidase [Bacteroidales bacterium]